MPDNAKLCEDAGQLCVDDDLTTTGFTCVCKAPSDGTPGVNKAATCVVRECGTDCATCAGKGADNICVKAGQVCVDPDNTVSGDWQCLCANDNSVVGVAGPATCGMHVHNVTNNTTTTTALDECAEHEATCAEHGQACVDQVKTETSLGDWECVCNVGTGSANGRAADCVIDECDDEKNYKKCHDVGQKVYTPHN